MSEYITVHLYQIELPIWVQQALKDLNSPDGIIQTKLQPWPDKFVRISSDSEQAWKTFSMHQMKQIYAAAIKFKEDFKNVAPKIEAIVLGSTHE